MTATLEHLRRYAIRRSLLPPTDLQSALDTLAFVQADPIRSPARAQDLTLRHRVTDYRSGDLERRYASLDAEEDFFINYGFVSRRLYHLMHPRSGFTPWPRTTKMQAEALLEFVRDKGVVHPREVDQHFSHGSTRNYWGGQSKSTTHLLDAMHYRGFLRVAKRSNGIRLYAVRTPEADQPKSIDEATLDALIDVLVRKYGPLPTASLSHVARRLRYAVPQWQTSLTTAVQRARKRLPSATIDGSVWHWPEGEDPSIPSDLDDEVRLLAPFDPIVWDRRRFEWFWGWAYRFEAYTPIAKRKLGYYALPLLWRDRVIGWGNVALRDGELDTQIGYTQGRAPRDRHYWRSLEAELERMRVFLRAQTS